MTASVRIRTNGHVLEEFESGTVLLTMADAVNTFELSYFAEPRPNQRRVRKGDYVEVLVDADEGRGFESVLEGYVDAGNMRDGSAELELRFSGRSAAQDLVDTNIVSPDAYGKAVPKAWENATLDRIVSDIAAPYGVSVFVELAANDELAQEIGRPLPSFAAQRGESPMDAIRRAISKRGLYAYSVGRDLVLARAGNYETETVLERGVNVREWEYTETDYNRFSEYRLKAQGKPTDDSHGGASSQLAYTVRDEGITRHRPLLIQADAHDGLDTRARAELERNLRIGQSESLTAYAEGWAMAEGYVWRPNTLVRASNPVIEVTGQFLVVTARLRFGPEEFRETQLELVRPGAYDVAKYPAKMLSNRGHRSKLRI